MATVFSDYVASNEKEIDDNQLVISKMASGDQNAQVYESADALIESIYENIKAFEKEAIMAGREYSRHRMNQCIAVSIYGVSLKTDLKAMILFGGMLYVVLMLRRISKKFPRKA
ncbi:MAG: hypothetical protein IKU27_08305 [Clostridia bacterium]|nr:hypothetical protein [Clostridia bacterium]